MMGAGGGSTLVKDDGLQQNKEQMMSISVPTLVVGATGNIGREVVALLRNDPQIELWVGSRGGQNTQDIDGVATRALDLLDTDCLQAAFAGIERVLLITPAHPLMAQMTANAVTAARVAGVKHVVRISGAGADLQSEVAIARLQGLCDQLLVDSGLAYTLLRPKNFMQNFSTFMRDMVRSGAVYSSQGDGLVPFVDVRDIAQVAAQVLRAPEAHAGRAYTLTGPQALSNAQAVALIAQAIERPVQVVPISEEQAVAGMAQAGMQPSLVEAMSSLNRIIAAGWVAEVTPDVPQLLGREATSFAQFAHDYRAVWV